MDGVFKFHGRDTRGAPLVTFNGKRLKIPWDSRNFYWFGRHPRPYFGQIRQGRLLWMCMAHLQDSLMGGDSDDYVRFGTTNLIQAPAEIPYADVLTALSLLKLEGKL